ncbi:hypothetical protein B0H14DRAFT_3903932 [Mycena olivaceomarginata]|nr:hypothetical protein B0H14DRAFT_3903932 [Mycena olivaceomarginata]
MSRPLWRAVASSSRVMASASASLDHSTRTTRHPCWINPKSPPADNDVRLDAPSIESQWARHDVAEWSRTIHQKRPILLELRPRFGE